MSQRGFPLFPTAMPHNLHTYNLPHAASIASLFLPRPPKKLPVLMISASFDIWKTLPLDLVEPKIAEHHIIWITICKANVQRQSLSIMMPTTRAHTALIATRPRVQFIATQIRIHFPLLFSLQAPLMHLSLLGWISLLRQYSLKERTRHPGIWTNLKKIVTPFTFPLVLISESMKLGNPLRLRILQKSPLKESSIILQEYHSQWEAVIMMIWLRTGSIYRKGKLTMPLEAQ